MGQTKGVKRSPAGQAARINAIFTTFQKRQPSPTTELIAHNPYQLLVAVVLSAQATDKGVNKATAELFDKIHTPSQMLTLGEAGLSSHIKTIGLFRGKAKNVIALSQILQEKHNGEVPHTREELEALPGVGRKTANVILNTVFGQPTLAVDTHVFRVARRLGLSNAPTPEKTEADLMRIIPQQFLLNAHHWLILHGRYTCTARTPKCGVCPVEKFCNSDEKFIRHTIKSAD
ncbi:MAG: endonuclease III [Proteobacteria bacterium]|nr:endonuclease III [Pseudomonadota bacterium]